MSESRENTRFRRRGALSVAAITVLLAALLAACGEKSEPEPPTELSPNALIAQGDDICERAREDVRAATSTPVDDAAGNAEVVGELIRISEREIESLEALEPPDQLEEPLARYLAARQEALDQLRDARAAAEADEAFEFARIQAQISDSQPERTRLAGEVGFETCSRVGDTADVPEEPQPEQGGGQGGGGSNAGGGGGGGNRR